VVGVRLKIFPAKSRKPTISSTVTGALKVDGELIDRHPMPRTVPVILPWCETFCVGLDTGTAVDEKDYHVPFRFTGKINKLTVKLGPSQIEPSERKKSE
jgi:arylsulfatase